MKDQRSTWLPILVRADFVIAVLLTVIAPLVLLFRALQRREQRSIAVLLSYWRASSLLMIAVYLLIGERRVAFVCGIGARLLIPWVVLRAHVHDRLFMRWRRIVSAYCLFGAALTLPMLRHAIRSTSTPLSRAYIASAQQYGDRLHPRVDRDRLGRIGEWGLRAFIVGTVAAVIRNAKRDE